MKRDHPVFESSKSIRRDQVIWRYFDLTKFIWLLQNSSLYFCRADLLGDRFEGSFTKAGLAELEKWKEIEDPEKVEQVFRRAGRFRKQIILDTFINCWHEGNYESMSMWKGYGDGKYGVAVCSTYGQLFDTLPEAPDVPDTIGEIYLAKVEYIDLNSPTEKMKHANNTFGPFVYKSLAYQHEKEIRAVFSTSGNAMREHARKQFDIEYEEKFGPVQVGYAIPIELNKLVNKVIVSPLAEGYFEGLVKNLCQRYGFGFEVVKSASAGEPVFFSSLG